MIVVLRAGGLRVVIYVDDHPPPHVHVLGDGEAKILLVGENGRPEIVDVAGMKLGDLRKALVAVAEAQSMLLEEWSKLHG